MTGHGGGAGRVEIGVAWRRLRAALARLGRDGDPQARELGAQVAREAAAALHALAERAEQASSAYRRQQAELARLGRRLDRQLAEVQRRQRARGGP